MNPLYLKLIIRYNFRYNYRLMNIVIDKDILNIELSTLEKILSFHNSFKIPFYQIKEISDILLPYT